MTREFVEGFFPYLYSKSDKNSINDNFILRAIDSGFFTYFSDEVIKCIDLEKILYSVSEIQYIQKIISIMTKKKFNSFFKEIEMRILELKDKLNSEFVVAYLSLCNKNKAKTKIVETLFEKVDIDQITSEIWEYLKPIRFKLPYNIVLKLIGKVDTNNIIKLIPSLKFQ